MFYVVGPGNRVWKARYLTEDAAWHRLLGVKRLRDTAENRALLLSQGWSVIAEDEPANAAN